jgi:hypothetical protein
MTLRLVEGKKMIFRNANYQEMSDDEFLRHWIQWFAGPNSRGRLPADGAVPRLNRRDGFDRLEEVGCGHGLDAFCRTIVREQYKNTMQATDQFVSDNNKIIIAQRTINPLNDRPVNGVRLTEFGLRRLRELF